MSKSKKEAASKNAWLQPHPMDEMVRKNLLDYFRVRPLTPLTLMRFSLCNIQEQRYQAFAPVVMHGALLTALVQLAGGMVSDMEAVRRMPKDQWPSFCGLLFTTVTVAARIFHATNGTMTVDPVAVEAMCKDCIGKNEDVFNNLVQVLPLILNKDTPEALWTLNEGAEAYFAKTAEVPAEAPAADAAPTQPETPATQTPEQPKE